MTETRAAAKRYGVRMPTTQHRGRDLPASCNTLRTNPTTHIAIIHVYGLPLLDCALIPSARCFTAHRAVLTARFRLRTSSRMIIAALSHKHIRMLLINIVHPCVSLAYVSMPHALFSRSASMSLKRASSPCPIDADPRRHNISSIRRCM